MSTSLLLFVATAVLFDFLNGFHDSSNVVSTMISSRALSPRQALTITAIAEFIGPFVFGVAVATTIGHQVLAPDVLSIAVIFAGLVSAVLWNLLTWYLGVPSSSSHALIGGLLGAAICRSALRQAGVGLDTVNDVWRIFAVVETKGLLKVVAALLLSPLFGLVAGFVIMKLLRFFSRGAGPGINGFFKHGQVATAIGLALSHGSNDAQKTMGVITMGLVASGALAKFEVPIWVVALSALSISLGTAFGGWRLIHTLGGKFYKIRPVHGFTTQLSAAAVILGAAIVGGPVSTTQVVSSAIMGAGSAERISKVRWHVGMQIALTWIVTIPSTAVVAALIYLVVGRFL
ncbi:MAG: inorganic phosphate transporter [Deltaproteobacteria bacterium]|nr:inorganic phosphate transporter [Deltaproteobacteria bacterium]